MAGETEAELNKLLEEEEVEELEDLPLEEDDEDAEEHEMVVEAPQQPAPPAGSKKRKAEDVLPVAPEPEEEGSPITAVAEGDLTTDAKAADQDDDHEHDAPSEVAEDLVNRLEDATGLDLDGDGFIVIGDVLLFLGDFGCTANCTADINGDGTVTVQDLLDGILASFGDACP